MQDPGPRRWRWCGAGSAGAALLFSVLASPEQLPRWLACPSMLWLEVPCPGCGLTRSFCAISHAQFRTAWLFNPWGFVFYALALVTLIWPLVAWQKPEWETRLRGSSLALWAPLALVAAMWSLHVFRLWMGRP